jgi:hypothetical protein
MTKPQKLVPIEWPEAGIAAYANHLLASFEQGVVHLTFCQLNPPAIVGSDEEKQKRLDKIESLKALPVARLAIPMDAYRTMLRIMSEHLTTINGGSADDSSTASHA